jgi:tRNA A37 N6-isopentenylltransferase MiaA
MNLATIGDFINNNGLAVFLLLCIGWGIYKIYVDLLKPYFQKKLNNTVENEDSLQDTLQHNYFKLVKENSKQLEESRKCNDRIMKQLEIINVTNQQISETNRKLVESYDTRICTVEKKTDEIGKTVEKINTKLDIILK